MFNVRTKTDINTFWTGDISTSAVERRLVFAFGRRTGELTVSIALDQPVPDLSRLSDAMLAAAALESKQLSDGETIVPQLVFAAVSGSKLDPHGTKNAGPLTPVVTAHDGREIHVIQVAAPVTASESAAEELDMASQMRRASAAIPAAAVAPGDYAVGFFIRNQVLHYYPLLAVTLPSDLESYKDSSATTTDLVPLLPFQS